MEYELKGRLVAKYDTTVVNERMVKREFVVECIEQRNENQFVDYIKFQLTQTRCSIIDKYKIDDEVVVHFNLKGSKSEREGVQKYFTNIVAWRVESPKYKP